MELNWIPEVPENISSLVPYPPGKPIEETEREYGITGVVKLASNESPLGPSPKAVEAMQGALKQLHLYPDGSHYHLKRALSQRLGCATDEICVGNGSNEFIDLLPRVFVARNRNMITHKQAFVVYKLCAQLQGCELIESGVDENFKVDVDDMLRSVNDNTRLVILANPNNPTGNYLRAEEVDELARELNRRQVLLTLDYAYWEYVTDKALPDPMTVFRKHPNVVIMRTFSKIYGLAGARVGYLIARHPIASMIERSRQPFNVSSLGLIGALAALDDEAHVKKSLELNSTSKAEIEKMLASFGFKTYQSQGNFVLVDMKRPSKDLYVEFLKRGVIIRPVANYGLPTHFRVSAGLPTENAKFFAALKSIFGESK